MQNVVIKTGDVLDRLKQFLQIDKDADLARLLGEQPKKLGVWRLRDTVPLELLISFCSQEGLRLEWVLTGEGTAREERRTILTELQEKCITEPLTWFAGKQSNQVALERRVPTLDQAMSLLRIVIEIYQNILPDSKTGHRDIPMIFRHFIDNFDEHNDEVEIHNYIEDWF